MSREKKILLLIKYVTNEPYKYSVFKLSARTKLSIAEILELTGRLNLEVLGHELKNKRRDVERYMEYNSNKTAKEIMEELGAPMSLVYDVAKKIGHRLENDYSKRERNSRLKFESIKFRIVKIKNKVYSHPIYQI